MSYLRTCLEPGCPELVKKGRCNRHTREFAQLQGWSTGFSWVYHDKRWWKLRAQVRNEQPFCARVGCNKPWTDLDHKIALRDGGIPFDRENVHGLCKAHHSAKTLEETTGKRPMPNVHA
jgi:hypothetical protein